MISAKALSKTPLVLVSETMPPKSKKTVIPRR